MIFYGWEAVAMIVLLGFVLPIGATVLLALFLKAFPGCDY